MSNKPMKAAHSRHTNHGKDCAICNPPKKLKGYRERKAPLADMKETKGE